MDLRQLRYFVAVAEQGNISQAAKRIFLTQSALSRQIKALEDEIGQCLLERQAHSIRLTPVGEALLRDARDLLQHADQVLERARDAERGPRLRIGYAPSLAAGILSTAVESFTQAHPNARVELLDSSTNQMLVGVEGGSLDVVLSVGEQHPTRGLTWELLARAPWRLAVSRNHPLSKRSKVTLAEVVREPLLGFCQREYPEYWGFIRGCLRHDNERPKIAAEYDGTENLMAAVESGLGVAFVTTHMARLFPKRVRFVTLACAPDPVPIAVGRRTDRAGDKVLAVFVEEVRKAARSLA